MKISLKWLKEYVSVRWTPSQIAERLTLAGLEVKDRQVVGDDVQFECEVTPNRPDWLGHVGVARELAALAGVPLKLPKAELPRPVPGRRPSITVQDRKACRRYVGIVLEDVAIGPSPSWLQERLAAVGIRSINNVVDVTNFVLFELGQPLHAFDLDRLAKGRIVVRRARAGESLITIDGATHPLNPSILVIADADRPVAVAGIMGGKPTEVSAGTRRILLESAWFDPLVTRRASRALGLASDSSYRFERGVDFEQVAVAARRAAALIVELAGGRVIGGPTDKRVSGPKIKAISWDPETARALGTPVPATKQRQLFERLGCRVAGSGSRWRVTPPSHRADLKQSADLVEELARLWGYERIPVTLPRPHPRLTETAAPAAVDVRQQERRLRELLVAAGLDEIQTYSLLSLRAIQLLYNPANVEEEFSFSKRPWDQGGDMIPLKNPLSQDYCVLRPTLLVGALQAAARNLNRRAPGVALFELGRTYHGTLDEGRRERRTLSLLAAGLKPGSWDAKPVPWDFFHLKGILESVGARMGGPSFTWETAWVGRGKWPWYATNTDLKAYTSPTSDEGVDLGQIAPDLALRFDIQRETKVFYAELEWPAWWAQPSVTSFQPLPKVPPVTRDFAIEIERAVSHEQIVVAAKAAGGPLVQQVTLFDRYEGRQIGQGKISVAYTVVYSAGDRTLTDAEVAAAHTAIRQALQAPPIHATLR